MTWLRTGRPRDPVSITCPVNIGSSSLLQWIQTGLQSKKPPNEWVTRINSSPLNLTTYWTATAEVKGDQIYTSNPHTHTCLRVLYKGTFTLLHQHLDCPPVTAQRDVISTEWTESPSSTVCPVHKHIHNTTVSDRLLSQHHSSVHFENKRNSPVCFITSYTVKTTSLPWESHRRRSDENHYLNVVDRKRTKFWEGLRLECEWDTDRTVAVGVKLFGNKL